MDKFTEVYKRIINEEYWVNVLRDMQKQDRLDAAEDKANDLMISYWENLKDKKDQAEEEILDTIDFLKDEGKWDKMNNAQKTFAVLKAVNRALHFDLERYEDNLFYFEKNPKPNSIFASWAEQLDKAGLGEYNFLKQQAEVEQCGDAAPVAGGPVGGPPPPCGCDLGGMGPAGTPPIGHVPPPPPPSRAGINTRNIGALYVPTAPFGWWNRFKNTSTKKKRKKVKRRKKK